MKKYSVLFVLAGLLNCSPNVTTQCLTEGIEKKIAIGKPVLKIGDSTIYEGHIDVLLELMPGFKAGWDSGEDKKKIVSQLVEQELFFQKAQEQDLLSKNERLQKNLWLQARNFQAGTYLLQEVDKRAVEQYEKDKERLYSQVDINDIVILYQNTGSQDPEEQKKIAMTKAQSIHKKLTSKNFKEIAAVETEHPIAKANGGNLGMVSFMDERVRYLGWEPLIVEAFKLKKGKISNPIATSEGVHIIQPVSDPQVQTYDAVLPFIRTQMEAVVKEELLAKMLANTKIEYLDPSLKPDPTP